MCIRDSVNDIKSVNMINSLQGKSAGMMITPNSTGAGGSSTILFRGNKSIRDVYKRQKLPPQEVIIGKDICATVTDCYITLWKISKKGHWKIPAKLSNISVRFTSVSYTHLDVYKRQCLQRGSIAIHGSQFSIDGV